MRKLLDGTLKETKRLKALQRVIIDRKLRIRRDPSLKKGIYHFWFDLRGRWPQESEKPLIEIQTHW